MKNSSNGSSPSTLAELWLFLRVRKEWWLGPILVVLLAVGLVVFVTDGTEFGPFLSSIKNYVVSNGTTGRDQSHDQNENYTLF